MKKAIQYCRSAQKDDQHIAGQLRATEEYARSNGLEIVDAPFVDNGISGLHAENRPAFMKMIRLLDSGKADFDTILVYDYSRWGRFTNCKEAYYWEFICNKHGVRVVFTDESVDQFPLPANIGKSLRESMRGRRRDSADDSRVRRGQ